LIEQPIQAQPGAEMANDWSREEAEAIVSDYFEMLLSELSGKPFNKAEHNRNLQKIIKRDRGSIEFKHQNISAVLIEFGYPYVKGYKPRYNYQRSLLPSVVLERLAITPQLRKVVKDAVEKPVEKMPAISNVLSILVQPPKSDGGEKVFRERNPARVRRPFKRNYLQIESNNQSLGLAGEKLVLEFEFKRLWKIGKRDLANRIEHVSVTQGDGLGFDILSFEKNGRERLIEVKTTRFGESTPFFASRSEIEFSDFRETEYQLYRLYNFTNDPKLFLLPGSLRKTCSLDPVQFEAIPR
jgi:hypothetical protein